MSWRPAGGIKLSRLPPIALSIALAGLPALAWSESSLQREERIKAALVFKLVKFVNWPAAAMSGREPIQICALGESRVGEALSAVDGKPARDRLAQFRKIAGLTVNEIKGCHVLYIPANAREIGNGLPGHLRGRGVLTVSDASDFARRGGMIGLVQNENKLSFEINLRSARESGIEPGAPLLELAVIIE